MLLNLFESEKELCGIKGWILGALIVWLNINWGILPTHSYVVEVLRLINCSLFSDCLFINNNSSNFDLFIR